MIQLDGLIESYKREVAPPGEFEATFPNASEDDIVGMLADGFAEAQLDGFFGTYVLDAEAGQVLPGLSPAGGALVVIYAGMRTVRNALRGLKTSTKYEAKGVVYETSQAASALTELLRDMRARRQEMLLLARRGVSTFVLDGYYSRMEVTGGFLPAEIPVVPVGIGSW